MVVMLLNKGNLMAERDHIDAYIVRSGGRRLAYAESGDPEGAPLLFFHGSPGSRLWFPDGGAVAACLGVRVLSLDRPGYGLSDHQPGRALLDWCDDVAALADHLQIDQFAIVGVSAGAVHAAACAYKLAARVSSVILVSMTAPPGVPGTYDGMHKGNRLAFLAGKYAPLLVRFGTMINAAFFCHFPYAYIRLLATQLDGPDGSLLKQSHIARDQIRRYREGYRKSSAGHATNIMLISRSWGFDVQVVWQAVHIWHGTKDTVVPPAAAEHLAAAMSRSHVRYLDVIGHVVLKRASCWEDVLRLVLDVTGNNTKRLAEIESCSSTANGVHTYIAPSQLDVAGNTNRRT